MQPVSNGSNVPTTDRGMPPNGMPLGKPGAGSKGGQESTGAGNDIDSMMDQLIMALAKELGLEDGPEGKGASAPQERQGPGGGPEGGQESGCGSEGHRGGAPDKSGGSGDLASTLGKMSLAEKMQLLDRLLQAYRAALGGDAGADAGQGAEEQAPSSAG